MLCKVLLEHATTWSFFGLIDILLKKPSMEDRQRILFAAVMELIGVYLESYIRKQLPRDQWRRVL